MTASRRDPTASHLLDGFLAEPGDRALAGLIHWLLDASVEPQGSQVQRTRRLDLLAEVLRAHPRQGELREALRDLWAHRSNVRLLAETGLPTHLTLGRESLERVVDRFIPRLEPEGDLHVLLSHLSLTEADAAWLEGLAQASLEAWRGIVTIPPTAMIEAARLLALRLAGVGVAREVLDLARERPDSASPFFRLAPTVDALALAPASEAAWMAWVRLHADCRVELATAHVRLETRGVSTDLIYRLELLEAGLMRLDDLLSVAAGRRDGRELASELVRGSMRQRGVRALARTALKRLARKVVEHTGETGERYIVRNRHDWSETGRTAGWAGLLTAVTALGKYALGGLPLAPMVLGLGLALDYSVSFVLLQLFHLPLASKQPAMTAAALAGALEEKEHLAEQVELVAGISRSQVIATIGNVVITMPAALAIVALGWLVLGGPPLRQETALRSVHGMHAALSLTAPYAALTGVFLWLASLAAGWAANWSAYRGLPAAVARRGRLRRKLGADRARWLGEFLEHNLSGIVGYVVLGFLLGFMPVVFQFMGLPVEVRHVTLNAASLAIAVGSLYGTAAFNCSDALWGLAGVAVTGACNFGVSFGLALGTAMRARDLERTDRARLWAALRTAFRQHPSRFLWRPAA
jgi:site-specific recombinase